MSQILRVERPPLNERCVGGRGGWEGGVRAQSGGVDEGGETGVGAAEHAEVKVVAGVALESEGKRKRNCVMCTDFFMI